MLQPPQLKDVSSQYSKEIAELRSFLAKAGVPIGTPEALASVAFRVLKDRAFHRDLTASLWVTTEGGDRQIGFADLLGVLAIASAGIRFATDAEEQDVLTLLRFLKEIRTYRESESESESDLGPAVVDDAQGAWVVTKPVDQIAHTTDTYIHVATGVSEPRITPTQQGEKAKPLRRRSTWLMATACFLLVFALSVGLYRRWFSSRPVAPQPPQVGNLRDAMPGSAAKVTIASGGERTDREPTSSRLKVYHSKNSVAPSPTSPAPPIGKSVSPATFPASQIQRSAPASTLASDVPPSAAAAMANASSLPRSSRPSSAGPLITGPAVPRSASTTPVPAATLSKRLGAPTLPQYASSQNNDAVPDTPRRPRLLRRHPAVNGDPDLIAGLQPIDNSAQLVRRRSPASTQESAGSVRPTALGMMAANVLYSPAPAYPLAASAAHVTGEVKLEAEVDRSGNVTYARVVSGPPLLRDAAMSALQQWRFRPYLSRGKAVSMTAQAVMDFQMP